MLIDNEISLDSYRKVYKRFANSLPEAWLYSLGVKDCEKFRQADEDFE